jgi:hypothetical protein
MEERSFPLKVQFDLAIQYLLSTFMQTRNQLKKNDFAPFQASSV